MPNWCNQAWADDVTVDWASQWDAGHYSAVVAVDSDNVYLMDPWTLGMRDGDLCW
jgi:predicted double-glycine peptidase